MLLKTIRVRFNLVHYIMGKHLALHIHDFVHLAVSGSTEDSVFLGSVGGLSVGLLLWPVHSVGGNKTSSLSFLLYTTIPGGIF